MIVAGRLRDLCSRSRVVSSFHLFVPRSPTQARLALSFRGTGQGGRAGDGGVRTSSHSRSRGSPTQNGDTGYIRRFFIPLIKEPTGLKGVANLLLTIYISIFFCLGSLCRFHFLLVLRESTQENKNKWHKIFIFFSSQSSRSRNPRSVKVKGQSGAPLRPGLFRPIW